MSKFILKILVQKFQKPLLILKTEIYKMPIYMYFQKIEIVLLKVGESKQKTKLFSKTRK